MDRHHPDRARTLWAGLLKLLLLLYLVAHVSSQLPAILDPLTSRSGMVNWLGRQRPADDVVQVDGADPELQYFKRAPGLRRSAPGYAAVLGVTRAVGQPVLLAKAYPWLLVAIALGFVFALGRRLAGAEAGFLAGVLFLHHPGLQVNVVGLPIGFAWPLLAATAYYVDARRPRAALVCVGLSGLFYPPVALLGALLFAARRLASEGGRPWRDRALWALGGLLAVLFVIVVPWKMVLDAADGPMFVSYEGRLARDAAAASGAGLLPPGTPVDADAIPFDSALAIAGAEIAEAVTQPLRVSGVFALPLEPALRWTFRLASMALALLVLGTAVWLGRRAAPPRIVVELAVVGVGCYLLATLVAFRMFVPQRYVLFALPLAAMLWMAVLAARALGGLPMWPRRFAVLGLAAAYLLGCGSGLSRIEEWVDDYGDLAGALTYLGEDTPADAVVAGPPRLMDAVELFADREALVYCQELLSTADALDGPVYADLWGRVDGLWRALYATDEAALAALMDDRGVDYLLVDRALYGGDGAPGEYGCDVPPAVTRRAAALRGAAAPGRSPFVLDPPPPSAVVYEDAIYCVVARDQLAATSTPSGPADSRAR